jgi:uncharacterized protein (TIGR02147 family)
MVNIFEFRNYRDYLKKCYEERKRKNALYSYQAFSRDMNFNNKGFLFNVLKGKKNLSGAHCYTISKILEHTKEQAEYFEKIVAFTQARNEELRTNLLEKIQEKSTIKSIPPHIFGKERHEYLSQWYHSAVRALIDIVPISDNYELISQRLFPPITATQAKKSVELLERLDFIRKGTDGTFRLTRKNIRAGDELSHVDRKRFHREITELAKQSIIGSDSNHHFISSVTMGISAKTYEIIHEEALKFKNKVIEIANNDEKPDRVYQYQLNFFPLTKKNTSHE